VTEKETTIRHVYFHIPFCPKLCPYCSFYVETSMRNKTHRFLDALLREVERQSAIFAIEPETIYFGGGTPTMLSISQLDYFLSELQTRMNTNAAREWTFEINPATVSLEKAKLLRSSGVNRISMGVQSWDDAVLKTLGRAHTSAQAEQTFHTLREAGFENVNMDLMFAVPGQTREQWQQSLEKTIALKPEHVSAYCLTYEEDTEFFQKLNAGNFSQNDERDAEMFETTMATLARAVFSHYEISNYAQPGRESLHNLAYWNGADYLGFGPSAFSTVGACRWQNAPNSTEYMDCLFAGKSPASFEEKLAPATKRGERIAFGLRTNRGLPAGALTPWSEQVREFHDIGLLQTTADDRVVLTHRGKLMADTVAEIFV
jgi:oxygen-independent coproporphyrinogen-3 oxidase